MLMMIGLIALVGSSTANFTANAVVMATTVRNTPMARVRASIPCQDQESISTISSGSSSCIGLLLGGGRGDRRGLWLLPVLVRLIRPDPTEERRHCADQRAQRGGDERTDVLRE